MATPSLSPQYYIRVTHQVGGAIFDQILALEYQKIIHRPGFYAFTIDGADDRIASTFRLDAKVEIYRALPGLGLGFYREFVGLHQYPIKKTESSGRRTYTSVGVGLNDLLARRYIMYPKGHAGARKSDYADNVIRQYVRENCGHLALMNRGRLRNAVMPEFTTEADDLSTVDPLRPNWEGDRSQDNLLSVIQDIAASSRYFFLINTPDANWGDYIFTVSKTLGSDRSYTNVNSDTGLNQAGNKPVVFSRFNNNVQEIEYSIDRAGEKNAVFATGKIDDVLYTYFMESPRRYDSPWNDREGIAQGSGESDETVLSLVSMMQEELENNQRKETIRFTPLQTTQAAYGKHYNIGDLITSEYDPGETIHQVLMGAKVRWQKDNPLEQLEMELID